MLNLGGAVEAEVRVGVIGEERLENVEHARHLREDEHAMSLGAQALQEARQRLQLAYSMPPGYCTCVGRTHRSRTE